MSQTVPVSPAMGYGAAMSIEPAPPDYRVELARTAAAAPVRDWVVRFVCVTFVLTLAAGIVGKMVRGDEAPPAPAAAAAAGPLKGAPSGKN